MIEAHGADEQNILRPTWRGQPGWPVLVPVAHVPLLASVAADRMPGRRPRRPGADSVPPCA